MFLVRLSLCTGSSEPSLLMDAITTKFWSACPYQFQLIRFMNNYMSYTVIFKTFICSFVGLEILVGHFPSFLSSANFFKIIFFENFVQLYHQSVKLNILIWIQNCLQSLSVEGTIRQRVLGIIVVNINI